MSGQDGVFTRLKREVFRNELCESKTLEQTIEEVKELHHQLRVYKERAETAERKLERARDLAFQIREVAR